MAALNESSVVKRFHGVSATQDSIQSLSLWVIHHKAHHERIVELWFKVFKKAKVPHRLTLLYLCNDIVQTCKRKHAIIYKDAFKEILKDAALLVRDSSIRKNVLRIFTIWEERKIYDGEFISELKGALDQVQPAATLNSRLLAEFQPSAVVSKIRTYTTFTNEGELKRSQLNLGRMDALNLEAVKNLKDRAHGKEFSQQFEDACVKLEDYISHVEREIKEGQVVIELLEQGELFYDAQYGEAKIVANAYKNFGTRVSNLKRKLEEHMKTLPSPVPSPTQEAPSPGNTPPMLRETIDNNEAVDMDLSDEEDETAPQNDGRRRESTITTGSYMKPIASITTILMKQNKPYDVSGNESPKSVDSLPSPKGSPIGMSPTRGGIPAYASFLNNAGASFLANAKDFALSDSPKPIPTLGSVQKGGLEEFLAGGDSTPLRDENMEEEGRAGTPVMDEALESAQAAAPAVPDPLPVPPPPISIPPHLMPAPPVQHPPPPPPPAPPVPSNDEAADNPMEFLTQLIIHHQAQKKGSKESSKNDFLKSLSDMAKPTKSTSETSSSDKWTSWNNQSEQNNTPMSASTSMSAASLQQPPPPAPPTAAGLVHLPVPPPPPPNLPLPPRPPAPPTSFPFSQSMPTPPVQSGPCGPQSGPMFPGPPPPRPGNFNNGIPWTPPPPPPPPVSSASGNPSYNSQNSQGFGSQNNNQNSQGYDQSDYNSRYDSRGYDSQNYDNQEFGGGKPPLGDQEEKFGPRGPGMSPYSRPNHNNLTTVPTQDYGGSELNSPVRGGPPRPPPPRPPFPLGMGMRGPRPLLHMPNTHSSHEDADEFVNKLRHKSVSSPPAQGGPPGPRRTLTEISTRDKGEENMDTNPQDDFYMEGMDDQGAPIATVSGRHPRNIRRLSSSDNGPSPMGHKLGGVRPRMPPPSPSDGHFRPRFDHRDSRDNYAPRERYESFHRDRYPGDGGFGRPPMRKPPPMRGGFYPRF